MHGMATLARSSTHACTSSQMSSDELVTSRYHWLLCTIERPAHLIAPYFAVGSRQVKLTSRRFEFPNTATITYIHDGMFVCMCTKRPPRYSTCIDAPPGLKVACTSFRYLIVPTAIHCQCSLLDLGGQEPKHNN